MLTGFHIGPVFLQDPVILAPMSGVTDLPFRRLAHRFGAGMVVSEMIASNEALRHTVGTQKRMQADEGAGPRCVQLAGHDPSAMAETARFAADQGAQIIDLNFGCPAKKVTTKYCGSALMQFPDQAAAIIGAVVRAVDVPVTVKMRTGWDADNRNAPEIAHIAEAEGAQMVTVHGRTRDQKYRGEADWDFIRQVRDATSLPLIVNGDITSAARAREALRQSDADGVMIGRAAYGRPWAVGHVLSELKTGEPVPEPDLETRRQIMLEHYDALLSHHGAARGVRMARKHLSWYIAGLHGAASCRNDLMQEDNPMRVVSRINDLFDFAASAAFNGDANQSLSMVEGLAA